MAWVLAGLSTECRSVDGGCAANPVLLGWCADPEAAVWVERRRLDQWAQDRAGRGRPV